MANRTTEKHASKSDTLPSSPSHSASSSSDFEFSMSICPRKSSTALCPADDLFYKGQLLPLHLSPRISMVRTLLSSSTARDSSGSSNDSHSFFTTTTDCDSSRPSSVTEDDEFKRFQNPLLHSQANRFQFNTEMKKTNKHLFSLSRFSSVFRKEPGKTRDPDSVSGSSPMKRVSATAREVIRKYLKKVKPLYEKFSQKQQQQQASKRTTLKSLLAEPERKQTGAVMLSHSFSGNLRYPRRMRRSCVSSCPSSMRSSPSHSGVLSRSGFTGAASRAAGGMYGGDNSSTMEELQSAIQGAISHCRNSWNQNKSTVSNEI